MATAKTAQGGRIAASSGHPLATAAAMEVLGKGGTVVDAAVCAALVLSVVMPHACGLGGDAFLLIHDAASGRTLGLNGTGRSPSAATPESYAAGIPKVGARAATVPGLLAALEEARARFGRRPLADLIEPALTAARDGFEVNRTLAANIRNRAELLSKNAAAAEMFLPGGTAMASGAVLKQPALARTLSEIAREGCDTFYRGAVAHRMVADVQPVFGLLASEDLASHRSLWQEPMRAPFGGAEIVTQPPNSYGITLLLQLIELGRASPRDPDSAGFILESLAARKHAYALARPVVGDPDRLEAPARALLAQSLAATPALATEAAPDGGGCTTNFVAIDRDGNAVSLITSISAPFGAGVLLPQTGIVLNNRMGGFSTEPESPNRVGPKKRPAHTLAPCLVFRDGAPWASLGTPGAAGQTATLAQLLVRLLAHGQGWSEAIDAPRWSVDLEGRFIVEELMPPALVAALASADPSLRTMPSGYQTFGSIKAAWRDAEGVSAIADGRRAATAATI